MKFIIATTSLLFGTGAYLLLAEWYRLLAEAVDTFANR